MADSLADLWLGRPTRAQLGGTLLVVPLFILYFYVIVVQLQFPIAAEYGFLFLVAVSTLFYQALAPFVVNGDRSAARKILYPENYTIRAAIPGLLAGISLILFPFAAWGIYTGTPFTTGSFQGNLQVFGTEVLCVAVVEEFYFRHVLVNTLGGFWPQVIFALSHPSVRTAILSDPIGTLPNFFYFLVFGLIFMQLVFLARASALKPANRKWFGLPLSTGIHGGFNTLLILWPTISVLGMQLHPFQALADPNPSATGWAVLLVLGAAIFGFQLIRYLLRRVKHHGVP